MSNDKKNGFTIIEIIICFIIISILSQIGIVAFRSYSRRVKAFAAQNALLNVRKECQMNKDLKQDETFTPIEPKSYSYSSKKNNCSGGSDNFVYLNPIDENYLPTYFYDHNKGEVGCLYNGFINNLFNKCVSKFYKLNFEKNSFVIKDTFIERGCSAYAIVKGDNWEEAERQSNILGGNLVTINDKDEYRWLQENIWKNNIRLKDANYHKKSSNRPSTYYVGLNDSENEGEYKWSSGQKTDFGNNEDLIHRQMWLAQRGMGRERDYFMVQYNDIGFTDYVPQDGSNPTLYGGQFGQLSWVKNASKDSWYSYAEPFGIAEIDKCSSKPNLPLPRLTNPVE